MNLLPGTVRIDQGVRQIELADGTCIPAPSAVRLEGGQSVIFGTRPENLSLEDQDAIAVQVVTVEPTGADTFVVCRHRGSEISAVFRERHSFTPGSTIHLRPDTTRGHLFDPESGIRLPTA